MNKNDHDELIVAKSYFESYQAYKRLYNAALESYKLIMNELNGIKGIQYDKDVHITVSELQKELRRHDLTEKKEKALLEMSRLLMHIRYVENLISLMEDAEKEIIIAHYLDNKNQDEIAKEKGLSQMQIRTKINNILLKAIRKSKT